LVSQTQKWQHAKNLLGGVLKTIGNYTAVKFDYRRVVASFVVGIVALVTHLALFEHPQQALDLTGSFFRDTLLTQFMHMSWGHLLLNLAGLAVLAWGFEIYISAKEDAFLIIFSLILTAAYVGWIEPLVWYCGLSGALHGVFVAKLLLAWDRHQMERGPRWPLIILGLGLIAKLLIEWFQTPGVDSLAGGPVAIEAHRGGVMAGLFLFAVLRAFRSTKSIDPDLTHR
jgi:rhomboid family GlyGly-CTERM serine protease